MTKPPLPQPRDIPGALYGSRLITLPHVQQAVARCTDFVSGPAPTLVEVGFDHGRRLQSMATLNPDWRFLGLEVRARRVRSLEERAARLSLTNLLVWRMDARTVFSGLLAPASADIVEVLFPTPWWSPKLRAKRLLVEPDFVEDAAKVLRPGGLLHVASDVPEVIARIDDVVGDCAHLSLCDPAETVPARPDCEQLSRREWSCTRDGIPWQVRLWRKHTADLGGSP
jgi:tRNA (guanine-N7-)-methyltransferase